MKIKDKISLLSGKDVWHTDNLEKENIPSIMLCDGPHGLRKQVDSQDNLGLNSSYKATLFPSESTVACTFNKDLAYQMGEAIGKEARANDVQVVLGPGVNIKRNPLCGRNFEYYSEDPFLSGMLGYSWIKGLQSQNVGASLKHFACNNQETNRFTIDSVVDERALHEIYLKGFSIAIKANPATVMCCYNKVNGVYGSENPYLLKKVLRDEWKYQGVVVSDWGAVSNREKGLKAGLDLEMPSSNGYNSLKLHDAYLNNQLTENDIDISYNRIVNLINKYKDNKIKNFDSEENHEVASSIALEGTVLLKNENILPLRYDERIAFVGQLIKKPRVQGGGSSFINPIKVENILEELNGYSTNYQYFDGYSLEKDGYDELLINEVCKDAKNFDKIIVLGGLFDSYETEGLDRLNMDLPFGQIKLIEAISKVNTNIVFVFFAGSQVSLPFESTVKGIVNCNLPGAACAKPLLDILYGKVSPSGRLATTFPYKFDDDPSTKNFGNSNNSVWYEESIYVGYRYYTTYHKNVLYPFGYGLSYSKFNYSDFKINKSNLSKGNNIYVEFIVKNNGNIGSKEVIQIYVENNPSTVDKPLRELRYFDKIYLEPNEEKVVSFKLNYDDFSYYDINLKKFSVNKGIYKVQICKDANTVILEKPIEILENEGGYLEHQQTNYHNHQEYVITSEDFEKRLGRKLPPKNLQRNKPFTMDATLSDLKSTFAGRQLKKLAYQQASKMTNKTKDEWMNKVIEKTLDETPVRALATMSGGLVSLKTMEGILDIINGHIIKGIRKL